MGIRSTVVIGMEEEDYQILVNKIEEISDEHLKKLVNELLCCDCDLNVIEEAKYRIIKWSAIKWCPSAYKDIRWLMDNLPSNHIFVKRNAEYYMKEDADKLLMRKLGAICMEKLDS